MLSSQEDQEERRRVLANDQRVREQSGTFLSHTHPGEGGRFTQVTNATVVGADPIPKYPQASPPWQGPDLVGDEPPLGLDNPAYDPGQDVSPAQGIGDLGDVQPGKVRDPLRSPSFRRLK